MALKKTRRGLQPDANTYIRVFPPWNFCQLLFVTNVQYHYQIYKASSTWTLDFRASCRQRIFIIEPVMGPCFVIMHPRSRYSLHPIVLTNGRVLRIPRTPRERTAQGSQQRTHSWQTSANNTDARFDEGPGGGLHDRI